MVNKKKEKTSEPIPPVASLYRYFIWANNMRTDFDELLANSKNTTVQVNRALIEDNMHMSYWYAGLYVVIEGWKELKLEDTTIDNLLNREEYVDLLRRYRNGVFHYQKAFFDERYVDVWQQSKDFVNWVRALNRAFGGFFLEWDRKYNLKHPLPKITWVGQSTSTPAG